MSINEDEYWSAIATVIKMEMAARGLSQEKLGRSVGISRDALGNYLSGKREMPFGTFVRVAKSFGMTVGELIAEAERRIR